MIQIFHQNIIVKSFRYLLYRCLDSFDFLMNNFMDKLLLNINLHIYKYIYVL
ncbi:hypothetical protein PFDG_05497 [Plasmodium falciparum Dd2]|uniref:Uncharacterized protein n=1 Tax=Plasmodium falciparum (isolate Dd2) TaxID=57267 RepID=A0A0L7M2S8_PLAF4|nr:hypothetical protein PFDG_05497 [Plasmodium falciparum Dd2]